MARRRRTPYSRAKPQKPRPQRALWRIIDGAVADAINQHPEYFTDKGRMSARSSIVKRVTGTVYGFALESARASAKRRSVSDEAAAKKGPGALFYVLGKVVGVVVAPLAWARGLADGLRASRSTQQRGKP